MPPKILLTGSSGYIGGTLLDTLTSLHPEYEFTVLLRKIPEGFSHRYPNVKTVIGDFNDHEVMETAATNAEIVLHSGGSDVVPSVTSLLSGLAKRPTSAPSFFIHMAGAAAVSDYYFPENLGQYSPRTWSDVDDIEEIWNLPDNRMHRSTDKIVFSASETYGSHIKTAIIAPADVFGNGTGLGRTQSFELPLYTQEVIQQGYPFYVGLGKNIRPFVHVKDVVSFYNLIIEEAVKGGGKAQWGKSGYYLLTAEEVTFIDLAKAVGEFLKKRNLVDSEDPVTVSVEKAATMVGGVTRAGVNVALYMFASTSRPRSDRASAVLGWKPEGPRFWDTLKCDLAASLDGDQRSHNSIK